MFEITLKTQRISIETTYNQTAERIKLKTTKRLK